MSSIAIGIYHLPLVHPHNPVSIHPADAKALGIRNGDKVRISTPGNSGEAVTMLRDGVMRGAIAVEHGYGHKELGARVHYVDGQAMPHNPNICAGSNLNDLVFQETTGQDKKVWNDRAAG